MKTYDMYIDGKWVQSGGGKTYNAINPAKNEPFAQVPLGTRDDARKAIAATEEARADVLASARRRWTDSVSSSLSETACTH